MYSPGGDTLLLTMLFTANTTQLVRKTSQRLVIIVLKWSNDA